MNNAAFLLPLGLLYFVGCPAMVGCNLFDAHVKEFDLMRGMAADAATRLADGSIGQMSVSGQGLNPGIALEAAIVYRATAKYDGLAGQFSVSGQGTFGRQVDQAEIFAIINDSARSDSERLDAILRLLSRPSTQPAATGDTP